MVFVRTVLLIAVLLLGWVALRGGLHPSSAAVPLAPPATLPAVAAGSTQPAS